MGILLATPFVVRSIAHNPPPTFTTIIIVDRPGGNGERGFGQKQTFAFDARALSAQQIASRVQAVIPDVYAIAMPDGRMYETRFQRYRTLNGKEIKADWVAIWEKNVEPQTKKTNG
ncbi:hypothetical protein [Spirosoma sordidisoli]|nr:hypothetical protein [Spirosoma sordidisoli]